MSGKIESNRKYEKNESPRIVRLKKDNGKLETDNIKAEL